MAEAAARAWIRHGGSPLPVRITRVDLITSQSDGPLGPIWHSPYEHTRRARLFEFGTSAATPGD